MKKILVMYLLSATILFSHEQSVHQEITRNAYSLLKLCLGFDIPELLNHLDSGVPIGPSFSSPFINNGTWLEDELDIIWGNDGYFDEPFNFHSLVSINHFWDPDHGDYTQNMFTLPGDWGEIGPYNNAFQKMELLINGNYEFEIILTTINLPLPGGGVTATNNTILKLSYNSLFDMYNNSAIFINSVTLSNGQSWDYSPALKLDNNNLPYIELDYQIEVFVYEILGRVAHLLQDMSVPAHVHRDIHGNPMFIEDLYETHFIDEGLGWDYLQVYNQVGGYINPLITQSSSPIHYLAFTTAQMADHFGSNGPNDADGNDLISGNYSTFEYDYLMNNGFNNLPGPTGMNFIEGDAERIRDIMIPQAIRATAGLLYWFAVETGMILVDEIEIEVENNFTGGSIYVDNIIRNDLPVQLNTVVGINHSLKAIEPQFDGTYHRIWNDTESPSFELSHWTKSKNNTFIPLYNNTNIQYSLFVDVYDKSSKYIANLMQAHKVDKNYDTEFQGVISNDPKYMVKYSSGNIVADQWIYPNGYPLVFGGWGDQIVPNNSRSRPINNINQDLEVNANYKYLQHASSTAFISPGQRRFAKTNTSNGELIDMVYESGGNVWYEYSVDGGYST